MYLHVGNNENVREKEILGIFDADSATVSQITKEYLKRAEKEKRVHFASEEIPKSFVVYRKKEEYRVCFSQLSAGALVGRSDG